MKSFKKLRLGSRHHDSVPAAAELPLGLGRTANLCPMPCSERKRDKLEMLGQTKIFFSFLKLFKFHVGFLRKMNKQDIFSQKILLIYEFSLKSKNNQPEQTVKF